jgi:hypothetical protein
MAAGGAAAVVVVSIGLAVRTASSGVPGPAAAEHAAPKRPSLHAAPAADAAALNADVVRRLPRALAGDLLADGRPGMLIFLKADCDCSKGFARMISTLAPHLLQRAACTAVITGTVAEADVFAAETGLTVPFIAQPDSRLAQEWGVRKAGCFALVEPDGVVEAVWSGVSRQGFRELAERIGIGPLPDELLLDVPGAATAGCPFVYGGPEPAADPAPQSSQETIR